MNENFKKHIPLYIALFIPIGMVLLVAGFVYLPALFSKPSYQFLYAVGSYDHSYLPDTFSVKNGRLEYNPTQLNDEQKLRYPEEKLPRLYLYTPKTNESLEISVEQGKRLTLLAKEESPDGYRVTYGNGGDGGLIGLFFGGPRDYGARYIVGHNSSQKLKIEQRNIYDSNNFLFLGWVIK